MRVIQMDHSTEKMVDVGGGSKIFVRVTQYLDPWIDPAPAPFVLYPGLARSSDVWWRWLPRLSRTRPVIQIDPRGFGRSTRAKDDDRPLSPENMVEDLVRVIDSLGVGPIHYVGESLGGIVGAMLALQYPKVARTVALISTPIVVSSDRVKSLLKLEDDSTDSLEVLSNLVRDFGVEPWARRMHGFRIHPEQVDGLGEWLVADMIASTPGPHMVELINNVMNRQIISGIEEKLAGEKLQPAGFVMSAIGGLMASQSDVDRVAQLFKVSTTKTVPGELHAIMFTDTDLCIDEVLRHAENNED